MKNLIYVFNIAFLLIAGLGSQSAVAQSSGNDFTLGAMLAYGSEIENLGIGVNAEFVITEDLRISPSFIYYLPTSNSIVKTTWMEFNANANYYFIQDGKFDVFGLGGLNYSHVSVKYDGPTYGFTPVGSASDGRFGLNLGAGANMHLNSDSIVPFAELKYVIIDGGQLVLAAGVRFKI